MKKIQKVCHQLILDSYALIRMTFGFLLISLNLNADNFFWFNQNCSGQLSLVSKEYVCNAQNEHACLNGAFPYQKSCTLNTIRALCDMDCLFRNFEMEESETDRIYAFRRGFKKAVVIVPPYGSYFQNVKHLLAIFEGYDVFLFHYKDMPIQWYKKVYLFLNALNKDVFSKTVEELLYLLLESDSYAALNTSHKSPLDSYDEVIGCGQCYGAWVLLHAQQCMTQQGYKGFDKLILDSCPFGTDALIDKFVNDPVSITSKGKTESPRVLSCVTSSCVVKPGLRYVSKKFCNKIVIRDVLKEITVPTLFIHGEGDFLVTTDELKQMCNAVNHSESYALITPYRHLVHSLKAKELYCQAVNNFIKGNV